jgi:hypothetical protein
MFPMPQIWALVRAPHQHEQCIHGWITRNYQPSKAWIMSFWIVLFTKHGKSVLVTSLQSTQTLLLNPLQHQYLSQHFSLELSKVKSTMHHRSSTCKRAVALQVPCLKLLCSACVPHLLKRHKHETTAHKHPQASAKKIVSLMAINSL